MTAQSLLQMTLFLLSLLFLVQGSGTRHTRAASTTKPRKTCASPSRTPRRPSQSMPPSLRPTLLLDPSLTPGASTTSASTGTDMLGDCIFSMASMTSC
ncbi:ADGRG1 isoform 54, partial [Pongo abelii]|uniref:ADGRG1 isoform 54 n=1 Tax=Pongo abelii TaxID=9601 RepID=A0A2J8VZ57_PONAB